MAKQSPHGCLGGSSETGGAAGGLGRGRSRVPESACGASRRGARPWTPGPSKRCTDCPGRSRGRTHSVFHVASLPPRQLGADSGRCSAGRPGGRAFSLLRAEGPAGVAQQEAEGRAPLPGRRAEGRGRPPGVWRPALPEWCPRPSWRSHPAPASRPSSAGRVAVSQQRAQRPERAEQMSSLLRLSRFFPGLYWELAFCCRWRLHASRR